MQQGITQVTFTFSGSKLTVKGHFGFQTSVQFAQVTFLNAQKPHSVTLDGKQDGGNDVTYDPGRKVLIVRTGVPVSEGLFTVELQ